MFPKHKRKIDEVKEIKSIFFLFVESALMLINVMVAYSICARLFGFYALLQIVCHLIAKFYASQRKRGVADVLFPSTLSDVY